MRELTFSELKRFCNELDFESFDSTKDLMPFDGLIGQGRATNALEFGMRVKSKCYNIYVYGESGTGRTSFAKTFAIKNAKDEPTPPDLCYVYNFKNPKCPKVLKFPAGMGKAFKADMEELVNRLLNELPKVFATKEFENTKNQIVREYQQKRDELVKLVTEEAKTQNFGVKSNNNGIYFLPIVNGELINEEQFEELSQDLKDTISKNSEVIQKQASEIMRTIRNYEKATRKEVDDLEYSVGLFTVGHHMSRIMETYGDVPEVLEYLLAVKEDILENMVDFYEEEPQEEEPISQLIPWYMKKNTEETFSKYKINLIIDNSEQKGAPVIVDYNPTYSNLVGEVEYDNEFGNFTTDFCKIKSGLFHRANGGYLILQARDVISNNHSWEAIRQVLLTGEITTEPLREFSTGIAVSGIKPEPVKVSVKVIMIGNDFYYNLLYSYDDEFQKLFKIRADFDYEMNYSKDNVNFLTGFIKSSVKKHELLDFDKEAVSKIIEYSTRISERQDKLTTKLSLLVELMVESDFAAKSENQSVITRKFIETAIEQKEYRLNMYEEKLTEFIEDGTIIIDTEGSKVGEINGLAVLDMGDYCFAKPSKITATTYLGKAGIVNIEKEAEMSGSIHDKGVSVMVGYLGQTYAQDFPLSLSCRICFEQNYSGIDGDSASSTELYAVLSQLSELPIKQEIAVTGSMNQRGEIQPIGGVTYKIEGFFDLCKRRGLTGNQGVIIPEQNVKDLVCKDEVIDAVKKGNFHIYAIRHIDEGIEILTGVPAGIKGAKGKYPGDSVHGLVYKKLKEFHRKSMSE